MLRTYETEIRSLVGPSVNLVLKQLPLSPLIWHSQNACIITLGPHVALVGPLPQLHP